MASIDKEAVIAMMAKMKTDMRHVLESYAGEATELSVNSPDPHTPVIGCVQMALANAAVDYLVTSGATPLEAFQLAVNTSGQAMQQWVTMAAKAQGLQLKTLTGAQNGNSKSSSEQRK